MSAPLRKGWCPGALRPMMAKDGLLVRLRLTGGILPARHAHALADLCERHGNGLLDLSARGNLQIRGVAQDSLDGVQTELRRLGMLDEDAAGEAVRNVIASPLAGLTGGIDSRAMTRDLEARLASDTRLHALPGKFGFLIDDAGTPTLRGLAADVRFERVGRQFAIGLGGRHCDAVWIGTCAHDEIIDRAAQIAGALLPLFARHHEARRLRDLLALLGPDRIAQACGASRMHRPLDPTFTTARQIVGPRTFAGREAVGLAAPFGRLDSRMLRTAGALAAATPLGEIRLTPWRVLLVPDASTIPTSSGFITDPADPRLVVAACTGRDGCERGTTATHHDGAHLAASVQRSHADVTLHVSGCEKGCAKPSAAPFTLVGRDGLYDLVRDGRAGDAPAHRGLDLAAVQRVLEAADASA